MSAPRIQYLDPDITLSVSQVSLSSLLESGVVYVFDDDGDLANGSFVVSGLLANDRIELDGGFFFDLTWDSSTGEVAWQGVVFGIATGGAGDDFVVAFNANATAASIEALIKSLTYRVDGPVTTGDHDLTFTLYDAAGHPSTGPADFAVVSRAADDLPDLGANIYSAAFADIDGDGDFDLVLGAGLTSDIRYFVNGGDAQTPLFQEQFGAANPFDAIHNHIAVRPVFFDIDGDSDLDMIVGERDGQIQLFVNDGPPGAPQFTAAVSDPFAGISATYNSYSSVALGDIDGDGLADLLVGGSFKELKYFKNTGAAGAPAFTQQFGVDNPFDAVRSAGYRATPHLVDLDGDGDLDLHVGSNGGQRFYENFGTPGSPVFIQRTLQDNPLAIAPGNASEASYVDIDGDGDLDLILSGYDGMTLLRNTPSLGQPFTLSIPPAPPLIEGLASRVTLTETALVSGPALLGFDVYIENGSMGVGGGSLTIAGHLPEDNLTILSQGDAPGQIAFDSMTGEIRYGGALLGHASGGFIGSSMYIAFVPGADEIGVEALIERLALFNTAAAPTGSRVLTLALANADDEVDGSGLLVERGHTLGGLDVVSHSEAAPAFGDLDGDGDLDLVVGRRTGEVVFYLNIGTAAGPVYARQPAGLFGQPTMPNDHMVIALGDLDGDGDLDLVGGDEFGVLRAFENTGGAASPHWQNYAFDPFGGVSAFNTVGGIAIADVDGNGAQDIIVGTDGGFVMHFSNNGGASPTFDLRYGQIDDPLNGVSGSGEVAPTFGDFDLDGDLDLFLGDAGDGAWFENTGTLQAPVYIEIDNPTVQTTSGNLKRPVFVDINGDGWLDLVTGSDDENGLTVFLRQGPGVSVEVQIIDANSQPTLTGVTASRTFGENLVNATPQLLIQGATFNDIDGPFPGATVTLAGLLAEDRVSVRNQGAGAGQIGYDNGTGAVTFGGAIIGVFTGGAGATATMTFSAAATQAAVQAL
ncbi:MAG: hypothetical protein JWR84_2919, partial [Caulobacter sp.]|nr:hypothetical protein [Caulobacter sp.]